MWDCRQTVTSSATSKVTDRSVVVAVEFEHRRASCRATGGVDQIVGENSVGKTGTAVGSHGIQGSRVRCKCIEGSRHDRIAGKNVHEATTVTHTGSKYTTRVDTELG
jgi:hypothetical protein